MNKVGDLLGIEGVVSWAARLAKASAVVTDSALPQLSFWLKNGEVKECTLAETKNTISNAVPCITGRTLINAKCIASYIGFYGYNKTGIETLVHKRYPSVIVLQSYNHSVLSLRDSGVLIFMPESNQEALDFILQAYKICEKGDIMLPAIINIDNYVEEMVTIPTAQSIDKYLSKYSTPFALKAGRAVIISEEQDEQQIHLALGAAKNTVKKQSEKWYKKFRRGYGPIEMYKTEDAELVIVAAGSNCMTIKTVIDKLREPKIDDKKKEEKEGMKIGLARLCTVRPWPAEELKTLAGKKIAVLDQHVSAGRSGILHTEVKATLGDKSHISSFITNHILSKEEIENIFKKLAKQEEENRFWI